MDEKVAGVAAGVLAKVMLQVGDGFALFVLGPLGGEGGQGLGCFDTFGNLGHVPGDDGLLLVLLAVIFFIGQGAILKGNGQLLCGFVPDNFVQARQEETLLALDVVLFHIRLTHLKCTVTPLGAL